MVILCIKMEVLAKYQEMHKGDFIWSVMISIYDIDIYDISYKPKHQKWFSVIFIIQVMQSEWP